jgi:hypothetical protein
MKQRASLAATALAVAALAAAGSAYAAGTKVDLTIKPISETKAQFKGRITAENPECISDRVIKVKSRHSRLVKTRTNGEGKFDEDGKRPESGAPLKLKVKEKGLECEALIEHDTAH